MIIKTFKNLAIPYSRKSDLTKSLKRIRNFTYPGLYTGRYSSNTTATTVNTNNGCSETKAAAEPNKTKIDSFVPNNISGEPINNSLLAYAVSQALKNLIPPRLEDDYIVNNRGPILGEGRFGVIRPCTHIITGLEAAVKTQYKMQCKRDPKTGQFYELEALKSLKKGAYEFYSSYETALKLHIVTERLRGQSVFSYLDEKGWKKPRNEREEREAAKMVARLLRALNFSHQSGWAHLDVKFENFMFRKIDDAEAGTDPVLIDYGAARPLDGPKNLADVVGSPSYAAPEVVLQGRFTEQSDAWSVGVMAFTILQGCFPFERLESRVSDYNVYFCPIEWRKTSADAQDFVRSLLKIDPRERTTVNDALAHPWIQRALDKSNGHSSTLMPTNPTISALSQMKNSLASG
jgi:calcium/calmodulin-dependent protein kinase I